MAPSVRKVAAPRAVAPWTVTRDRPTPEPRVTRKNETATATKAPANAALQENRPCGVSPPLSLLTMVAVSSLRTVVVDMAVPPLAIRQNPAHSIGWQRQRQEVVPYAPRRVHAKSVEKPLQKANVRW